MKWASRISLFTMGMMLAVASRPVAANPIVRTGGPEAGVKPDAWMWAWEGGCSVRPFLAIVTNPAGAGLDPAELDHQLARLNALKAMALSGQGSLAELAACELGVFEAIELAIADQITIDDAMLFQAESAQDLLAALIGLPMLGIDGLASIDTLAAGGDVDEALAALLGGDSDLSIDGTLADALSTEEANGNGVNFASSFGGGAWYGGHLYDGTMGGSAINAGSHTVEGINNGGGGGGGGGSAGHNSVSAAAAVPLPSGAWAGMLTLAVLATVRKFRIARIAA